MLSALCWSHEPAHDISPVALEVVKKIDAIFDIERQINGPDIASRLDARHRLVRSLVEDLHDWMRAEQGTVSKHNPVAKAISYIFRKDRWDAFTLFLEDGCICLCASAERMTHSATRSDTVR